MIKTTIAFFFKLLYHLNCKQNMEIIRLIPKMSVIHYITEIFVVLERCLFMKVFITNYATYYIYMYCCGGNNCMKDVMIL